MAIAAAQPQHESQELLDAAEFGIAADEAQPPSAKTRARSWKIAVGAAILTGLLMLVLGAGLGGLSRSLAKDALATAAADASVTLAVTEIQQEKNLKRRCTPVGLNNCLDTGCCAEPGDQCYAKNAKFGLCMKHCDPAEKTANDPLHEPWSCDPIGTRYTPDYRDDYTPDYFKMTLVEPWIKNCSHLGESCAATKCCAWTGYYCYEKDASWSSCLSVCNPNKENGGITEKPKVQKGKPVSNPPPGNAPTFKTAPPGPWSCKRKSVAPTPAVLNDAEHGTTLFCFLTVLTDAGKGKTTDFELIKIAQARSSSIFACDHWVVFSDVAAALNPGKTVVVQYPKLVKRPNTKLWANLPLYINIWTKIKQEGTWSNYQWVVKADPTAVFIPQRLVGILIRQPVTSGGVYLENCKHVRMGFHGSLEIVSKNAFGIFLDHLDSCQHELPITNGTHTHFKYYGEDKFMAWCMHKHGVGRVPSRQEVVTVPAGQIVYGLHITGSCPSHAVPQIADISSVKQFQPDCTLLRTAGAHPLKKPAAYSKCLYAMGL